MERGMVEVHSERNGGRIKRWPVGALESKRSGEKRGMNGAERDRGRGKRIVVSETTYHFIWKKHTGLLLLILTAVD